jgi:hypothetical protein
MPNVHPAVVRLLEETERLHSEARQLYTRFLAVERRSDHLLARTYRVLERSRQMLARLNENREISAMYVSK